MLLKVPNYKKSKVVAPKDADKEINVTVQRTSGKIISIRLKGDARLSKLASMIEESEGIPTSEMRLWYRGSQLNDYGEEDDSYGLSPKLYEVSCYL